MPYIASTPEALSARLGRTDSLDPATTCRGISISSGKPCRRNVTAKAPEGKKSTASSSSTESVNTAEAFFCWQHKDQAADTVVLHRTDSQKMRRLQGRTSFDSLVEVILGPEAADGEVGPGQTQLLIRRETRLSGDEVMVVSTNAVVKKGSKIVRTAKKPGEGQSAVWDALHGQQQNGAAQGSGQPPYGPQASGQYPQANGQYQYPQTNGQYQQQYQHPGTYGISQVQQRPPHRPSAPAMGRIDETPGDTYPPNNEFKPPPPRPSSYRPKRPSLLAQLLCCLSIEDNDTPSSRPHGQTQQYQQAQPQMQSVRPTHQPPPINTALYSQPPPAKVQQAPSAPHHSAHLNPDAPIRPQYPPDIHAHNGWDKTPYPQITDAELSSSSAEEDSDGDDAESIALPEEAVDSITPTLPIHLSAKTRARIITEMRKPISQKDMPGYIYIFWLKDDSSAPLPVPASAPPTVSTFNVPPNNGYLKPRKNSYVKDPSSAALFRVVEDPYDDDDDDDESGGISPTSNPRSRGASIGAAPSSPGGSKPGDKRVLLKIGRAQNVQRRLHQWSQQCGYNLQLLRYYPYVSLQDSPSTPSLQDDTKTGSPSPAHTPGAPSLNVNGGSRKQPSSPPANLGAKKVPFSHRVERLIHLELRDDFYNKPHICETCQTVHKEWFAVPGTRAGVRRVDEVIKRWCKWAESLEGAVDNREQGGVSVGLGHRRGSSGGAATESQILKEKRMVTGGVRGVERMQWTQGYEAHEGQGADDADEEAKRQRGGIRKGTFGFL